MTAVNKLSRRDWLRLASAGAVGLPMSGWFGSLAAEAARHPERKKSCILLWMSGGPSQMDTFDLKPGNRNGGPFKEIPTSVPGIKISEHLSKIAKHVDRMAIIRSMSTREGDHSRATQYLHTGYNEPGQIQFPCVGSLIAKELADPNLALPGFVSIASTLFAPAMTSSGFLGPKYAPLVLGMGGTTPGVDYLKTLRVEDIRPAGKVTGEQVAARLGLLRDLQEQFNSRHPGPVMLNRQAAYDRAVQLMQTRAGKAFDLDEESPALRDKYGRHLFGQGCLLARRLVEQGVPFIEVSLYQVPDASAYWDSHINNFDQVQRLSNLLDASWATLMDDLKARGLLDSTLIVWAGEFGRTPKINSQNGRDHYPNAWSAVLAGGGIKGGQVIGKTSLDGTEVEERKVSVPDLLATICLALGIDPLKSNQSNVQRPIRIVDKAANPIKEVLG
jgi:hypothetical protein